MDRNDAQRLWPQVQQLLRAPAPPDDAELRRAARLLSASRSDAVELLLMQWLASTRGPAAAASELPAAVAEAPEAQEAPTRRPRSVGLREVALVTAGVAGGALLAGLLDDDAGIDLS